MEITKSPPLLSRPLTCRRRYSDMRLLCKENVQRLPDDCLDLPTSCIDPPSKETSEFIAIMKEKEVEYMPNVTSLLSSCIEITPMMRATLIDWMIEAISDFCLKRETLQSAVSVLDRYLCVKRVEKEKFQLLGLCSFLLAGKLTESCQHAMECYRHSVGRTYSFQEIRTMEVDILRTVKWRVFSSTPSSWMNLLMTDWDELIIRTYGEVPGNMVNSELNERMICFKQNNRHSYKRFRVIYQILDLALLHWKVVEFKPSHLAAGLFYSMVSSFFYESKYCLFRWNGRQEIEPMDPDYLKETAYSHCLVEEFLALRVGSAASIQPAAKFMNNFVRLSPEYTLPPAFQHLNKEFLKNQYEEYLEFQVHNKNYLPYIAKLLIH